METKALSQRRNILLILVSVLLVIIAIYSLRNRKLVVVSFYLVTNVLCSTDRDELLRQVFEKYSRRINNNIGFMGFSFVFILNFLVVFFSVFY